MKWLIFFILTLIAGGLYWKYANPKIDKGAETTLSAGAEPTEEALKAPAPNQASPEINNNPVNPVNPLGSGSRGSVNAPPNNNVPPLIAPELAPPPPSSYGNTYPQPLNMEPQIEPPLEPPPPPPQFYPENDSLNAIPPGEGGSPFEPPINGEDSNNGFIPSPPPPPPPMEEGDY